MSPTNEEKHQEAYEAAADAVRALDPTDVARRTGAAWRPDAAGGATADSARTTAVAGHLEIPALGTMVKLSWPELAFESPLPLLSTFPWRLIALHHLALAPDDAPGTDWVSYRELPDGLFYANTVTREVEEPLARLYARRPDAFVQAGAALGAESAGIADASLVFHPLPRVPVVFALWAEDDEFPAKVKVLYERTGAKGLPLQDLRIIADLLGAALKAAAPAEAAESPPAEATAPAEPNGGAG